MKLMMFCPMVRPLVLMLLTTIAGGRGEEKRTAAVVVADTQRELSKLRSRVRDLFDLPEETFVQDLRWYGKGNSRPIVQRFLRAMVHRGTFVVGVGGMSDTAGHGNLFNDSYPIVFKQAFAPLCDAAGIELIVRNVALGGLPSFPNSLCMKDVFGADLDLIVWDYRIVEHDDDKGELFIRQVGVPTCTAKPPF